MSYFLESLHLRSSCNKIFKPPVTVFIHSFIQAISIAPLQVHYYSGTLPTQHGYCVRVSGWGAKGNCEWKTCVAARVGFVADIHIAAVGIVSVAWLPVIYFNVHHVISLIVQCGFVRENLKVQ